MNRLSKIMVAALAVIGTACSGAGAGGLEGEETLGSVEQPVLLPNEGVLLALHVGKDGMDAGCMAAQLRFSDRPTEERPLGSAPWPANTTQTFALAVTAPEKIHKIVLRYGGYGAGCQSSWWDLRGVDVHDIRNGVKSTPRYAIMAPAGAPSPGDRVKTFGPVPAIIDEHYLQIPEVLKHTPSTNPGTFHEDFYLAYDTWNLNDHCARIKDNKFVHAPWSGSSCNWMNEHEEAYMDYLDWDDKKRRATVNTSSSPKTFTIKRQDGSVVSTGTTLRYKGRDGTSKWEMRFKG